MFRGAAGGLRAPRDRDLFEREECRRINRALRKTPSPPLLDPSDLSPALDASDLEDQLRRTLSVLRGALDSTGDGILIVDQSGTMVTFNRQFAEMWGLPEQVLRSKSDRDALEAAVERVKNPEAFLSRVEYLYANPDERSFDLVELKDGRILERYSQPHQMGNEVLGRIWSFRDVTERIQELLEKPFHLGEHEVFTTASIGIATNEGRYERPKDVLRDADLAMYRAKEEGGSRAVLLDRSMHKEAVAIQRVETDLRRALDREEFELHFQPIVRLADGALNGFEALIRWRHPDRGLLTPGEFLGIAEDTGLIVTMGRWVLDSVCHTISRWRRSFPDHSGVPIHFNVSPSQLTRPDFVQRVRDSLAFTGAPGSLLRLELTESSMMANAESTVATLRALKALEIGLSIDDFGTGYSSLSYLHRFPTDEVKIDRSFVWQMSGPGRDAGLVKTIIDLAHDLEMEVVAEGVETEVQAALLRELGCEHAQGFLFARPLPEKEAERVLVAGRVQMP